MDGWVEIGGLVKTGHFDPEDTECIQKMRTTGVLEVFRKHPQWKETVGQTQNSLEGSFVLSSLVLPWDSPGGTEVCHWAQRC